MRDDWNADGMLKIYRGSFRKKINLKWICGIAGRSSWLVVMQYFNFLK